MPPAPLRPSPLIALILLLMLLGMGQARAAHRNVLVLYSLGPDAASVWQSQLHDGLAAELAQRQWQPGPAMFEERLDAIRVGTQEATGAMAAYLRAKYVRVPFDAIISENFLAGRFLSDHPDLFPGVPRFYVNHGRRGWVPTDGTGMELLADFPRSIAVIPRVLPQVKEIVVVGDRSARVQEWVAGVRAVVPAYHDRIRFVFWDDLSFAELYRRAAALPADSAIYMLATYQDKNGVQGVPPLIGRTLARLSPVPVFTHVDSLIGGGVAGGYVISGERVGRVIARIMLGQATDLSSAQAYVFDDAAVQRFGLRDLPPGTRLLHQPQDLWHQYRWQIIGGTSLIVLQAALITALVLALRGRRQTLAALHDERNKLEQRVVQRTLELLVANDQLSALATTDPLTGIGNRRKMTAQIAAELERSRRLRHPLALLMVDIDHFKRINDSHGHPTGDRAIVAVATALAEAMRNIDMLARFGGEEFVLLLPETAQGTALLVAERLRATVAALVLAADDGQPLTLTISVGVATAEAHASPETASSLLVRADKALYRAKQAGRDRVMGHA